LKRYSTYFRHPNEAYEAWGIRQTQSKGMGLAHMQGRGRSRSRSGGRSRGREDSEGETTVHLSSAGVSDR
jgi:hypothetical protein